ncbi:GntR family transcriptional regulator [Sphingomonas sp. 1P06PA]|uniref:GntR family transcriptional regulator n=1 Tax=Sphingomonas sp. 1P06PA TaxID=554121 RepID=UPI0039A6DD5B
MTDLDTGLTHAERDFPSSASVSETNGKPQGRITHASAVRMAIEGDIFTGRLLPGTPIDEDALAERFGVSRTPVREAMLQLIQSGLIEKRARRGAIVARLHLPRLIHMFETISELEALCARFAATRIRPEERKQLIEAHEQAAVALERGDEAEYARLGRRFHHTIMRATHNSVLIETTDKLALHTLPYRRFQLRQPARSDANQIDHGRILEAILEGNGTLAAEIMRRHVTVQGDVLAEYMAIGGISLDTE